MSYVLYLDNRCSRHMTGKKEYLTDYVVSYIGSVTFVDGVTNEVVGFRILNEVVMSKLRNMLHVCKEDKSDKYQSIM